LKAQDSECRSDKQEGVPVTAPVENATWCRVQGSGFRVQGSGLRVHGSGFKVQSSGSRVQGSGLRVQGFGSAG